MQFQEISNLIARAGRRLKLKKDIIQRIIEPERIIEVSLPVKMDSGSFKIFQGFRVQHNSARGPYKGGIRYHPDSNLEEVKVLAALMSLKTALADIPFGGGKGAVVVDPLKLSSGELKRLTVTLARSLYDVVGSDKDIPAPDINTNAIIMKWFRNEYERIKGKREPGVITGKSPQDNGIKVRDEATGLGGAALTLELTKILGLKPSDLTVSIQGFGNVGLHIAHHLYHMGFRITAIAEASGGVYHFDGIDYHKMEIETKKGRRVREICFCDIHGKSSDCLIIGAQEILEKKVDILIPAAIGNQITEKNAGRIKAKIIIEMANAPINSQAEKILLKKGVVIVPDILANAGGVLASYLEWKENVFNEIKSYQESAAYLSSKMKKACRLVWNLSQKEKVSLREASYLLAIERIAKAYKK